MWFIGFYIMGKDKLGIERGYCIECECDEYEISLVRCDYCGYIFMSYVFIDFKKLRYDVISSAILIIEVFVEINSFIFSG